MSGWIKLHRKINDNPVLKKSNVYSNFEAFIWLLLRANYDDAKVVIGSSIYQLKNGEMISLNKYLKLKKEKQLSKYNLGNCGHCQDCWKVTIKNISYPLHQKGVNNAILYKYRIKA